MSLFDKGEKVKYYILSWNPILKHIHRKHDAKCGEREKINTFWDIWGHATYRVQSVLEYLFGV